jgi:predicted nucleic acid-binding protein
VASVLLDTGPLVALFKRNDHDHARAAAWFKRHRGPLLTTHAVVAEAWHLVTPSARLALMHFVAAAVDVCELRPSSISRVVALLEKYADLPMDYADATLLTLGEQQGVYSIATIDTVDFSVYRSSRGRALKLVL